MSAGPWRGDQLGDLFDALSRWLTRAERWWRPRAFVMPELPWQRDHPELAGQLRDLPLADAERIAASNTALYDFFATAPCEFLAKASTYFRPLHPGAVTQPASAYFAEARDVPGRKWQQIIAFAHAVKNSSLPATEWCAGKSHLGRHYARLGGAAVDALEWQRELVDEGNRLSQREHHAVRCHCIDVLTPASSEFLRGDRNVLALHACGQLHIHLLGECVRLQPQAIALAPCCYQLQRDDLYRPLSQRARRADLKLARVDLHTAVQESVTSPRRVQRQRQTLQAWRLGFDLLQRDIRGVDEYLPTPSLPLSALQEGFEVICRRFADYKKMALPSGIHFSDYEMLGERRVREVAALDLPRLLFRRALEWWLVLDRALLLQENGYHVEVGEFCERALTPRNLMIRAQRS